MKENEENGLSVDLAVNFSQICYMHTQHAQIRLDLVCSIKQYLAATQMFHSLTLPLKLEKFGDQVFTSLVGGCVKYIFDQSPVIHATLSVLLIVKTFSIIFDPLSNYDPKLIPENISQYNCNLAQIQQVYEELLAALVNQVCLLEDVLFAVLDQINADHTIGTLILSLLYASELLVEVCAE